ncbi:M23 family metallopeptidase [Streptomyces sp. NPDC000927]|uniref:M23 family metallopeptidase n=1 Tax=Streptomyces sp. NPDC000927 TaxID=3154371 RepID=UPI003320C7CC
MSTLKLGGYAFLAFLALGAFQAVTGVFDEGTEPEAPRLIARAQPNAKGEWTRPTMGKIGTAYKRPGPAWASGYHTGIDFVAPSGTPVLAAGPGRIISAGWGGKYGNQIVIYHEGGTYTQYAHLSRIDIKDGSEVRGGQQIGLTGETGNAFGPHLHFEARSGPGYGSDIDPSAWMRSHGINI